MFLRQHRSSPCVSQDQIMIESRRGSYIVHGPSESIAQLMFVINVSARSHQRARKAIGCIIGQEPCLLLLEQLEHPLRKLRVTLVLIGVPPHALCQKETSPGRQATLCSQPHELEGQEVRRRWAYVCTVEAARRRRPWRCGFGNRAACWQRSRRARERARQLARHFLLHH